MTSLERAIAAWGGNPPDWVQALARACDETSQRRVAEALDYSPGAVNGVVNNKWPASTAAIEAAVRRAYMAVTVICPVLGEIGQAECEANQARPFSAANGLRVRLYRACRDGCHHSRMGDAGARV